MAVEQRAEPDAPAPTDVISVTRRAWQGAVDARRHAEMYTGHGNTRRVETYKNEADTAAAYITALEAALTAAEAASPAAPS